MIKIGLTGIIGSGKTTVARIMESMGIPVFYADREAKAIYLSEKIKKQLSDTFGKFVINQEGEVDHKKLSDVVFGNHTHLQKINEMIHPVVREKLMTWFGNLSDETLCTYESALLFESNFYTLFDHTVTVSCPEEICIQRVMNRSNLVEGEILSRMRMQLSNEEKAKRAEYVIQNDGSKLLTPQIMQILRHITAVDIPPFFS